MGHSLIYDVIGIGFGPANLALAAAISDSGRSLSSLFLECKNAFSWHPGMLFKDATMQTSFLKDLVTINNPQSRFSFLNFLLVQGRLNEFISMRRLFPTRVEFNQYFKWVAEQLNDNVLYNTEVLKIVPFRSNGAGNIDTIEVQTIDLTSGVQSSYLAKNVVLGLGMTPNFTIDGEKYSQKMFHSSHFLQKMEEFFYEKGKSYRFVVIGSGQSAAEATYYLLANYPASKVDVISRGFIFKSIDDNPFVNELYSGRYAEFFFGLDMDSKDFLLNSLENTNYSVVDIDLINKIFSIKYDDFISQNQRLSCHSFSKIEEIYSEKNETYVRLVNNVTKAPETLKADIVCFCTGFNNAGIKKILEDLNPYLKSDFGESYLMNSSYRMDLSSSVSAGIFLQGYSNKSYGFTEGTIADLATRSQLILQNIFKTLHSESNIDASVDESVVA